MIELKQVSIKYVPDFFTIYNFNLQINSNTLFVGDEFLGSVSLMRLIAKIDKPTSGEILFDGINLKSIKDKNLDLAYLPKSPVLINSNIEKNLSFPLILRKIDKNTAKTRVFDAINRFNLNCFPKKIKDMKISEKKIIALLRANIRKPKYVLLEHFFEDLSEEYVSLANEIILQLEKTSTIIACEKEVKEIYKNYQIIELKN